MDNVEILLTVIKIHAEIVPENEIVPNTKTLVEKILDLPVSEELATLLAESIFRIYEEREQYTEALLFFERIQSLFPDNTHIENLIIRMLIHHKNYETIINRINDLSICWQDNIELAKVYAFTLNKIAKENMLWISETKIPLEQLFNCFDDNPPIAFSYATVLSKQIEIDPISYCVANREKNLGDNSKKSPK